MMDLTSAQIREEIHRALGRIRYLSDLLAHKNTSEPIGVLPGPVAALKQIAEALGTTPELIRTRSNEHHIVLNRQICQYVMRKTLGVSYPIIARTTRGHHSTVVYGCQKVEEMCWVNPELDAKVHKLCALFEKKGAQGETRHAQTVQIGAD